MTKKSTTTKSVPVRRFKPYPAYKDSDVGWLGEIPKHWEVKKVKRLCLVRRGASPRPIDDPIYFDEEGEYAWVRIADLTASERYLEETTQRLSQLGKSKSVALEPGELFVSIAGTVGKPMITKIKCCIHDGFVYFVDLRENREYLYYLYSCGEPYKGLGKLGTQLNLNTDTIGNIYFPRPSPKEQEGIVAFLDRETTRIDALVAKKERLIKLLQEKRSALITRAVTKGLDPNVPMKDSGVECLGEIPATWKIERSDSFLRYDKIQIEPSEISDEFVFHYSIPSVQKIGDGKLEPPSEIDSAKLRVVGKRLLVSKLNPRKGVVLIASEQDVPTLCSTEFVPFQVRRSELRWAMYLFMAESTRQRLSAVVRSATRSHQRAEVSEISKMWHGVPPFPEQRAIAVFLDRETARIDALVAKIREAIQRLKELRIALISAAVTGKIDVREEVA